MGDSAHRFDVTIPNIPGAQGYKVYAGTAGCSGPFSYVNSGPVVTSPQTQGFRGSTTILIDQDKIPAQQPPTTDQANQDDEQPSGVVPGAVAFNFEPTSSYSVTGGAGTQLFTGDQYNEVVIWADPGNTGNGCASKFSGGSNATLYGIFYMPNCSVQFTGGSGPALQGQLIANTITVSGGSSASLAYNANYTVPPPTTVLVQ
jgi:hypothetical protein